MNNTCETIAQSFLSSLPIIISSFYMFIKINKININIIKIIYVLFSGFMIIEIKTFIENYYKIYSKILFIILLYFALSALKAINSKSYHLEPSIIILIGISYCIQITSVFFTSIIFWLFHYYNADIIMSIIIVLIHIIITFLIMKIKRFKNSFSFFDDSNNIGIGLFISGFVLVVITIGGISIIDNSILTVLIIGTFISSIGLFLWIRKSITEHYRKKLQTKAEEHYQTTLAEKERYIEQLTNSNTYLSKVVHRDNHLMSSLQYSIEQFKNCDDENKKDKIINEILTLANERGDLLLKEQKSNKLLAGTGSPIIDGALGNMYVKAAAHNIDFNLVVNEEVHYLINNIISQTDLETLLCDHIKDAIIAIKADDNIAGKILVTIEMVDNIYEISIKDNGVDFDVDTLAKLGLERVTTHKDSGGSGIGFMTTFETLEKTNASLIIIEYENKTPFSKSITFRFDGLKSFIIKSHRSDELKEYINRDDMIIL